MKTTGIRILLAEDDTNLGILLKNYLTAKNYETALFINGIQALEAFRNKSFDLCILDIMMPEMDGLTLAREIRRASPEMPVIFLTAKNQQEDILEGFRSGADDYITKPFSMEELLLQDRSHQQENESWCNDNKKGGFLFHRSLYFRSTQTNSESQGSANQAHNQGI